MKNQETSPGEVRKNSFCPHSDIAKSLHTSRDKIRRIAKETLVYRFIAAEKPFLTAITKDFDCSGLETEQERTGAR